MVLAATVPTGTGRDEPVADQPGAASSCLCSAWRTRVSGPFGHLTAVHIDVIEIIGTRRIEPAQLIERARGRGAHWRRQDDATICSVRPPERSRHETLERGAKGEELEQEES